ncbi:MarR family winged helix-turn-helix transcriptional regulator [Bacillus sp. Marseille-Q3570]|uniref:MarR family winged helix-turn-helix transcriptional regulator n=1 Tax=Bacillus sp. Marseille-Q3570 TaxID=2963522 RepID=UPI0021B7A8C8|nr:MarR family transcriptional regulator [Bacillus sp. Marseille-Q3570]
MQSREELIDSMEKSFRKLFRSHRKQMAGILGKEVTASEFMFLQFLNEFGPSRVSDLAAEFKVNLSHVTNVTDKLASKKFITRRRNRSDRRIVELQITYEGSAVLDRFRKKRSAYYKQRFEDLKDEEIQKMMCLFTKLR